LTDKQEKQVKFLKALQDYYSNLSGLHFLLAALKIIGRMIENGEDTFKNDYWEISKIRPLLWGDTKLWAIRFKPARKELVLPVDNQNQEKEFIEESINHEYKKVYEMGLELGCRLRPPDSFIAVIPTEVVSMFEGVREFFPDEFDI
jgi:hypothetical protein